MNGLTRRAALVALPLIVLTACTDKGSPVEPTTTSPTTVQTSPPMLPSSSVASASPEPGAGS